MRNSIEQTTYGILIYIGIAATGVGVKVDILGAKAWSNTYVVIVEEVACKAYPPVVLALVF